MFKLYVNICNNYLAISSRNDTSINICYKINLFLCNMNTSCLNLYIGVTLWILHAIYFLERVPTKQKKANDNGKRPTKKRSVYAVNNLKS